MAPGRKAGTLVRATCCGCGEVELRRGVSARYRCLDCKQRHEQTARTNEWLGGHAAMIAVAKAVRSGRLPPVEYSLCDDCGKGAQQYDHRDYNLPLSVDPVCRSCNLKRGPAIPLRGAIARAVGRGCAPYRNPVPANRCLAVLGISDLFQVSTGRRLEADDWLRVLPQILAIERQSLPAQAA